LKNKLPISFAGCVTNSGIPQPYFPDKLIIMVTITFTLPGVSPGKLATDGAGSTSTLALSPKVGWLTGLDITNRYVYQVSVYQHRVRTMPWNKQRQLSQRVQVRQRQTFPLTKRVRVRGQGIPTT